jgi:hypothetical protein
MIQIDPEQTVTSVCSWAACRLQNQPIPAFYSAGLRRQENCDALRRRDRKRSP